MNLVTDMETKTAEGKSIREPNQLATELENTQESRPDFKFFQINSHFLSSSNSKDPLEIFKSKKLVPFINPNTISDAKPDIDRLLVQSNIVNEYQMKQQFGCFAGESPFKPPIFVMSRSARWDPRPNQQAKSQAPRLANAK